MGRVTANDQTKSRRSAGYGGGFYGIGTGAQNHNASRGNRADGLTALLSLRKSGEEIVHRRIGRGDE